MLQISSDATDLERVPLGNKIAFRIGAEVPGVTYRAFLQHESVRYLEPLVEWTDDVDLLCFPESPGRYVLHLDWRASDDRNGTDRAGRCSQAFVVTDGRPLDVGPHRVTLVDGLELWAPSAWEAHQLGSAEGEVLAVLSGLVTTGDVVYDIGANLGAYALRFANLVGKDGYVVCFEANPLCVHFLRTNVVANGFDHVEILPTAVLDADLAVDFTINYGNANLGAVPCEGTPKKVGHRLGVGARSLDELIATYALPVPSLIKIDVERAEPAVVRGMHETLARHHPRLLIELHGYLPTGQTLEQLDTFGYRYRAPAGPTYADADAVWRERPGNVFQIIAEVPSA